MSTNEPTTLQRNRTATRHSPARTLVVALLFLASAATGRGAIADLGGVDSLRAADSAAPASGGPAIGDTLWNDVVESAGDMVTFFAAPARSPARTAAITGGVVGTTALAMTIDERTRDWSMRWHNATGDALGEIGYWYGMPQPALALAGGLYGAGLLFDAPSVRRAGRHIIQAALDATIITGLLKVVIGRHRPFLGDGAFAFNGPSLHDEFNSLPSGHTTIAFAISSTLAAEIDNPWATAGLYTLATLTGVSRIYADRHWASDVVLGALVGTICGYGVVHLHDGGPGHAGLVITPTINGIAATIRF